MDIYYEITLDNGAKYVAAGDSSLILKNGDLCIIRKDFYLDCGTISKILPDSAAPELTPDPVKSAGADDGSVRDLPTDSRSQELPRIQREATMQEQSKIHENTMRAKTALRVTQQHVDYLKLPMKLINAHYTFDDKLITIQFSADGRVDFRELVKILSQEFNTRIELRQIGVRDETAIIGGISVCGRPLCCCVFLKDFASINVKMAKEQDLSLTPSTISGICGRLKCCLKYEHEGYLELEKGMPRRGDCCECKEGRGRIIDRNLLTQKVVVQLDDTGRTVTYPKEEVSVIYPEKYKINKKENYDDGNGEKHQKNHHNNNNRSHGNGNNNGNGNGNNNQTSQQGQNRNKEQHHDRQHHDRKAGNNTGNK